MDNETVNQVETAQQEKTFTQSELDAIIGERLAREREKYSDYDAIREKARMYEEAEEAQKSDLQKAQELANSYKGKLEALQAEISTRNAREKVASATGIPANLLTGTSEEECQRQAEAILQWRNGQPKYPTTKDGGEVTEHSGGTTREQFSDWFDKLTSK